MTPAFAIQVCGWLVGVPLQIMLIAALLRGQYKRFPFLFAYMVCSFLTTAIEIPTNVDSVITGDATVLRHFARIYWYDEWALQALIFAVVISLLAMATSQARSRRVLRLVFVGGSLLYAGISFAIHFRTDLVNLGQWMTPWTRDLNFCAAILDLILWAMLLASKERDPKLLLVSGALGIQFTGEAIGQAIRNLSMDQPFSAVALGGSVVIMLADLTCLYVWWRTFRTDEPRTA